MQNHQWQACLEDMATSSTRWVSLVDAKAARPCEDGDVQLYRSHDTVGSVIRISQGHFTMKAISKIKLDLATVSDEGLWLLHGWTHAEA